MWAVQSRAQTIYPINEGLRYVSYSCIKSVTIQGVPFNKVNTVADKKKFPFHLHSVFFERNGTFLKRV